MLTLLLPLLGTEASLHFCDGVANARNVKRVQSITRASEVSGGHALDYYR